MTAAGKAADLMRRIAVRYEVGNQSLETISQARSHRDRSCSGRHAFDGAEHVGKPMSKPFLETVHYNRVVVSAMGVMVMMPPCISRRCQ